MIITEAELRAALELTPAITVAQTARVMLAMSAAHASIRKFLRYDPEQKTYTNQLYPRTEIGDYSDIEGVWDVDSRHRRAVLEAQSGIFSYLQLEHLPVRQVTAVNVDPSAKFGQQGGDFGGGTSWTQGVEFMVEFDQKANAAGTIGIARSGQLIAWGAWPVNPGTVQVSYIAGYSPAEFAGDVTATNLNDGGKITMQGVDASPIKQACLLEAMRCYHRFAAFSQSSLTGLLVPGPKQSENLGSYSYSLASGQAAALLTGMQIAISPEAAMLCESYQHYGVMLL